MRLDVLEFLRALADHGGAGSAVEFGSDVWRSYRKVCDTSKRQGYVRYDSQIDGRHRLTNKGLEALLSFVGHE